MKLYYLGHNCLFAVEQMLFTLFPGEKPEYPEGDPQPHENSAVVSATYEGSQVTATTRLHKNGATHGGVRVAQLPEDDYKAHRVLQNTIRLCFYDAAVSCLGGEPPWGALTGVRPVKIPTRDMLAG
ncbi:MAG: coproporphyrinogen dehydrogenase HemZ, partial [Clostridia bacterium]|nr:coproporphyrinogen dehydrogenase HemZ [Clostridia bacterium]